MPSVSDNAIQILERETRNPDCILKEVTNSISAGIYISHGYASIYGSDVHDWQRYEKLARELPDLRLPVDSFEHFCLLLKKDPTTINTVLNRKSPEDLDLQPFDDESVLRIRVFNDINIVFGPKGTGKSCILKAIAKHYSENGIDATVYESASDRLDEIFDSKGKNLTIDLNEFGINYCTNEIESLRTASETDVTNVIKYRTYFEAAHTNRNAKKILIKDIQPEAESWAKRAFDEFNDAVRKTSEFLDFLSANPAVRKELKDEEYAQITQVLSDLLARLKEKGWENFSSWKEIHLLNSAIQIFRNEVERKTGTPALPTTTGFRDYALNRLDIERNATEIIKSVDTDIPMSKEDVGNLGAEKGALEFRTEFKFQRGSVSDSRLSSVAKVKKTTQKQFINCVRKISRHSYSDDLFEFIAQLNEIEDVADIKTTYELLLFCRYFALDGNPYSPSSGEASMVMLQKELGSDKEVYILDEPERSLGNEYINDVIVPLIKSHARAGKKVFISTHDANIAVRTLPYSSIYRCHGKNGYNTYVGNPFLSNLVNLQDGSQSLDWKKVSMTTLEGGEEAFGERGQIYGSA